MRSNTPPHAGRDKSVRPHRLIFAAALLVLAPLAMPVSAQALHPDHRHHGERHHGRDGDGIYVHISRRHGVSFYYDGYRPHYGGGRGQWLAVDRSPRFDDRYAPPRGGYGHHQGHRQGHHYRHGEARQPYCTRLDHRGRHRGRMAVVSHRVCFNRRGHAFVVEGSKRFEYFPRR